MKKYKAIFFDWDGTAVTDRHADPSDICSAMLPLLERGILLFIISGTTLENISGGELAKRFPASALQNLYMGLARGMHNFGFGSEGNPLWLTPPAYEDAVTGAVHDMAYGIHHRLLMEHHYPTDIVFTRPGYCKIDLLCDTSRTKLYLSGNEMEQISQRLQAAGLSGGLGGLFAMSCEEGKKHGLEVKPTCDGKYLEVGLTTKSDNVNTFMEKLILPRGITAAECCFWGDEYLELGQGIFGSDSQMITPLTRNGDFFDVNDLPGERPAPVQRLSGGPQRFLAFLKEQKNI